MLDTGRRSAISTSELGLYSDRPDRYHRSRYGTIVRKFAIGVMVVVAVILVAIFLYDFTSATSANSKLSQETKHIYILQNALRKSSNATKRFNETFLSSNLGANETDLVFVQDRSDDEDRDYLSENESSDQFVAESRGFSTNEPEFRAQNLNNFKLRKRVLKSVEDEKEEDVPEGKQLFNNHAVIYRVRQIQKHPDSEEEENSKEARPTPFHWEFKTPHPSSFKRTKYPQLSQYRYPQSSRNIQDIIKYLTNDPDVPSKGIKFTGVYVNPKKYDLYPDIGEMMSNSDRSEEEESSPYPVAMNADPFYQYKPKHPADVNLLATSNVRFSPTGIHRFNPYYEPLYPRPVLNYNKPSMENQFDNSGSYSSSPFVKKRKPKPFSVMLDIYPITDIMEQNKKNRPRPEDFESRRPMQYNRGPRYYGPSPGPIPVVAVPSSSGLSDEEERQQMIFHLNLYPRRKNKLSRHEIIHRSESMQPAERQQFFDRIMSPLESIAKHLTDHSTIEEAKFQESKNEREKLDDGKSEEIESSSSLPITRYQEASLEDAKSKFDHGNLDVSMETGEYENLKDTSALPLNQPKDTDDYGNTEKYEIQTEKMIVTTENTFSDCDETTIAENNDDDSKNDESRTVPSLKDVDTLEGFQQFSDGLLATD